MGNLPGWKQSLFNKCLPFDFFLRGCRPVPDKDTSRHWPYTRCAYGKILRAIIPPESIYPLKYDPKDSSQVKEKVFFNVYRYCQYSVYAMSYTSCYQSKVVNDSWKTKVYVGYIELYLIGQNHKIGNKCWELFLGLFL